MDGEENKGRMKGHWRKSWMEYLRTFSPQLSDMVAVPARSTARVMLQSIVVAEMVSRAPELELALRTGGLAHWVDSFVWVV